MINTTIKNIGNNVYVRNLGDWIIQLISIIIFLAIIALALIFIMMWSFLIFTYCNIIILNIFRLIDVLLYITSPINYYLDPCFINKPIGWWSNSFTLINTTIPIYLYGGTFPITKHVLNSGFVIPIDKAGTSTLSIVPINSGSEGGINNQYIAWHETDTMRASRAMLTNMYNQYLELSKGIRPAHFTKHMSVANTKILDPVMARLLINFLDNNCNHMLSPWIGETSVLKAYYTNSYWANKGNSFVQLGNKYTTGYTSHLGKQAAVYTFFNLAGDGPYQLEFYVGSSNHIANRLDDHYHGINGDRSNLKLYTGLTMANKFNGFLWDVTVKTNNYYDLFVKLNPDIFHTPQIEFILNCFTDFEARSYEQAILAYANPVMNGSINVKFPVSWEFGRSVNRMAGKPFYSINEWGQIRYYPSLHYAGEILGVRWQSIQKILDYNYTIKTPTLDCQALRFFQPGVETKQGSPYSGNLNAKFNKILFGGFPVIPDSLIQYDINAQQYTSASTNWSEATSFSVIKKINLDVLPYNQVFGVDPITLTVKHIWLSLALASSFLGHTSTDLLQRKLNKRVYMVPFEGRYIDLIFAANPASVVGYGVSCLDISTGTIISYKSLIDCMNAFNFTVSDKTSKSFSKKHIKGGELYLNRYSIQYARESNHALPNIKIGGHVGRKT